MKLVIAFCLLAISVSAAELDGTFSGASRAYKLTERADVAARNFVAEFNVTLKGGGGSGCAFIGLGLGKANPGNYHEPAAPLYLRMAPSDFGGGELRVGDIVAAGPGDGKHRVRFTWDARGKRAMFEVDDKYNISTKVGDDAFTDAGHLYVGGAHGVTFGDFKLKSLSDAEIKEVGFGENFTNDPSAGTWLPATATTGMRPMVCWYNGSKLAATRPFINGQVQTESTRWECKVNGTLPEQNITFKLVEGNARGAGVAVAFDVADWSPSNYVLVPAVVYNGNRFHAFGGAYHPGFPREAFFNPNWPLTMSNNPRLSVEPGKPGLIELQSGNAATPSMCYYSPSQKRGFIVLAEQNSRFGNNALLIEENAKQDRATFVVSAPGVRKSAAGFGGFHPSGDSGANWKAGDELTIKLRVYQFDADGIPALLEKFMSVRKELTGPNNPRHLVPMSKMSEAIAPRFKGRWMTVPAGSYYAMENSPHYQLGWVSGFMQTPLLALDDPTVRERMGQQFDFVVNKLQGKSGFFYGGITAEGKLRADAALDGRVFALTRKNADTLLAFGKFFEILKAQGHAKFIQPAWEQSYRRLAQAFVDSWNKSGEFGNYLDPATGEIAVYNSTSGAIVPGGLALAAKYFHDEEFLRVAKESANFYYKRDVAGQGMTSGHVGDTGQDPDSESAGGFLESLMALYWATGDNAWLTKARTEGNLLATWVLSHDFVFPAKSQIARLDGHMAGAVFANTQNKHGAPGICTASGDYLFKLYRATGDVRYAELIRDIRHASVEATDMPGHPTCGTGTGASMERIQTSDAEGAGATGNFIHTQNAWTEMNAWMMSLELPGVYLQSDTDKYYVFDSVEVKRDGTQLAITNPTKYQAAVSIFAETSKQALRPLDYTAYLKWQRVEVAPGQTRMFKLDHEGSVQAIP